MNMKGLVVSALFTAAVVALIFRVEKVRQVVTGA